MKPFVTLTQAAAAALILSKLNEGVICRASYRGTDGTARCAVGGLMSDEQAREVENPSKDSGDGVYMLARDLVAKDLIVISDMDKEAAAEWLNLVQKAVDEAGISYTGNVINGNMLARDEDRNRRLRDLLRIG